MSATAAPVRRARPRRRLAHHFGLLLMAFAGVAGVFVAYFALDDYCGWREWAEACAEADRLDPGWRWEDLFARMPHIPDERNGARHVEAAQALLPPRLPNELWIALDDRRNLTRLERRLRPAVAAKLATMLDSAPAAVAECHALADCPSGRFPWSSLPTINSRSVLSASPFGHDPVARYLLFPQLALRTE